jgi:hypothetical protein
MTRRHVFAALATVSLAIAPMALMAQRPGPGGRPDAVSQPRERPQRPQDPERRAEVEQQLRERFSGAVKQQLGLDDAQVRKLQEHNRKFADRRQSLVQRERDARGVLREELQRDQQADNPKVATALQELMKVQKERSALLEDEDKSLSEFLTPLQRARYMALQEAMRKRIEELRKRAAALGLDGGGPPPPATTPPAAPPDGAAP